MNTRHVKKMQTEWKHYDWNETFTNNEGLSLRGCMSRYGVGGWYSNDNDMVAALIFLSADKSADNAWLLEQGSVRTHDEALYTYKLSPDTLLGANIKNLLANSVFEKL